MLYVSGSVLFTPLSLDVRARASRLVVSCTLPLCTAVSALYEMDPAILDAIMHVLRTEGGCVSAAEWCVSLPPADVASIVVSIIREALSPHPQVAEVKLSGSGSRGTYIHAYSDVDVIVVLSEAPRPEDWRGLAEALIPPILQRLSVKPKPRYRTQAHSIGLRLSALTSGALPDVDLVFAIRDGGALYVFNSDDLARMHTYCEDFIDAWHEAVKAAPQLRRLALTVKCWKYRTGAPMTGFHIERILRRVSLRHSLLTDCTSPTAGDGCCDVC